MLINLLLPATAVSVMSTIRGDTPKDNSIENHHLWTKPAKTRTFLSEPPWKYQWRFWEEMVIFNATNFNSIKIDFRSYC